MKQNISQIYASTQLQALWCCYPPSPKKTIHLLDKLNEWMNIPITTTLALVLMGPERALHMLRNCVRCLLSVSDELGTAQQNQ